MHRSDQKKTWQKLNQGPQDSLRRAASLRHLGRPTATNRVFACPPSSFVVPVRLLHLKTTGSERTNSVLGTCLQCIIAEVVRHATQW